MITLLLTIGGVIGFLALTLGTALFVASEFSLTALERSAVDNAVLTKKDRRARQVQIAHRSLSFQLSGAQLGITITTLITGYLAEPVLSRFITPTLKYVGLPEKMATPITMVVALIAATALSMVVGELIPKNYAIAKPMTTARATSGLMITFSTIFKWAINGLNSTANAIVRRFGIEPIEEVASARSVSELESLVTNSALHGVIDSSTAELVNRSLHFGGLSAEDLMTPRVRVESLLPDDTVRDLIIASSRTGFSRFPIAVDNDLDNITGFVHIKQAFTVPIAYRANTTLLAISQNVPVVPASLDGDTLMTQIRSDGMQVAIVVDEYGGTAGIVTTEDLIEEIVGNVTDEHDDERADIQRSGDGYLCSGLLRIDEVFTATGYRAPEGHYDTLGGFIMFLLGRLAREGDTVDLPMWISPHEEQSAAMNSEQSAQWNATVQEIDGRRIDLVQLTPLHDSQQQRSDNHHE